MELSRMRKDAARIWTAAIEAVRPARLMADRLRREGDRLVVADRLEWPVDPQRGYVLGIGKAAADMVAGLADVMGDWPLEGIILTKDGHGRPVPGCRMLEAAHPLPDQRGEAAAREVLHWLRTGLPPGAPLVVALSGGGSALFCLPAEGITLADKIAVNDLLLSCGADIREINAIRKHLSAVKGGQLARLVGSRPVLTLVISDVVGDPLDAIASGPTVPDPTTFADALAVLDRYDLRHRVPPAVRQRLEKGSDRQLEETVKPGDPVFENKRTVVLGNNFVACEAAAGEAEARGYTPVVLSSLMDGDTAACARFHQALVREAVRSGHPAAAPVCVISGGETTVTVTGDGRGGRNQEYVLHWVRMLAELEAPVVVASVGTDGTDGPTDAAGALADNETGGRAGAAGLDPVEFLADNDSFHFFDALDDLIRTGPTGTNVMDVRLHLVGTR